MKYLYILTFILSNICTISAQDVFSKISLSGFEVSLIPSDTFSIRIEDESLIIEESVKNDILHISVTDQTGRVPKGSIVVHTNKLDYLNLHNCVLVMDQPIVCDSLELITASSVGTLRIKANYLSVNIGAGSSINIEGETEFYNCGVGAASNLQSSKLIANRADINIMGYSSASVNAKEVVKSEIKNSNLKNNYKK